MPKLSAPNKYTQNNGHNYQKRAHKLIKTLAGKQGKENAMVQLTDN